MKLKEIKTVELIPTAPFNFDATLHKPDHFTSGDNYWEPGIRWQTWWLQGVNFGLKFANKGITDKPKVLVTIYASSQPGDELLESLIEEIKYRYNLELDLGNFYKQFSQDKD